MVFYLKELFGSVC